MSEYVVARKSAIIGMSGGRRVTLVKGAILRSDSLVVKGREDMFKPLASSDLMARTSFRVGNDLIVKGAMFSVDDPLIEGREQFFVPVSERAVDPVPPAKRTVEKKGKRITGPKPTTRRIGGLKPQA